MTSVVEVPAEVIANINNRWPGQGAVWVQDVLRQLLRLCARYEAEPQHLMSARFGLVVAVATPGGPLIMKSTPDPAGQAQAAFARRFADLGVAPTVHEVVTTVSGTWTVMDYVFPGEPLEKAAPTVKLKDHLVGLLHSMVGRAAPFVGAPDVADWLAARLIDASLSDLPPSHSLAAATERLSALETLDSLRESSPGGLCHGDANLGNILVGEEERLWWVDPRGVRGEVAYDVAVVALKAAGALGTEPEDLAAALADEVGVCPARTCAWVAVAHAARV